MSSRTSTSRLLPRLIPEILQRRVSQLRLAAQMFDARGDAWLHPLDGWAGYRLWQAGRRVCATFPDTLP